MNDFERARRLLISATGFDIDHYKRPQINRLLRTAMLRAGENEIEKYVQLLGKNKPILRQFHNKVMIHFSEFFRDWKLFDFLRKAILPELLKKNEDLQIWSAGCGLGEEAYSLAMLLEEQKSSFFQYHIWATDIDSDALLRAGEGSYLERSLKNVSPLFKKRYFFKMGNRYEIIPSLRSKINFERDNLVTSVNQKKFNLILCRNVMIYFAEKFKQEAYERLVSALHPGGILFIGSTETLLNSRELGLEQIQASFYRKPIKNPNG